MISGEARSGTWSAQAGARRGVAHHCHEDGRTQNGVDLQAYAIQDETMLRDAAAKQDAWIVEQRAKAEAERKGQVRQFKKARRR